MLRPTMPCVITIHRTRPGPTIQDATPVTNASSKSASSARFVRRPAMAPSCHRPHGSQSRAPRPQARSTSQPEIAESPVSVAALARNAQLRWTRREARAPNGRHLSLSRTTRMTCGRSRCRLEREEALSKGDTWHARRVRETGSTPEKDSVPWRLLGVRLPASSSPGEVGTHTTRQYVSDDLILATSSRSTSTRGPSLLMFRNQMFVDNAGTSTSAWCTRCSDGRRWTCRVPRPKRRARRTRSSAVRRRKTSRVTKNRKLEAKGAAQKAKGSVQEKAGKAARRSPSNPAHNGGGRTDGHRHHDLAIIGIVAVVLWLVRRA